MALVWRQDRSTRTIRIWDASTGESRREPLIGHTDWVYCVAFSADGHYLASGAADETIRVWDITQGFEEVASIILGSSVWSVSFSPKSNYLVSGSGNGALHFWNISSGSLEQLGEVIYGHSGLCIQLHSLPTGYPSLLALPTVVLSYGLC